MANTKLIRAASGSLFRIPIRERVSRQEFLSKAQEMSWQLVALHAAGTRAISESRFAQNSAIIVGSEGRGVAPELLAPAVSVTIPTSGVESLNAAVAASIALYEASRQRRTFEPV
jgi:TrmH family RNA methyltransferase